MKKWNSKWFLLFLFTFFSVGMQAQYSEDASINAWITDALNSDGDSSITYGDDEVDWPDSSDITTDSQIAAILNENSAGSSSSNNITGEPYYGGVNANGVMRVFIGNEKVTGPTVPGQATVYYISVYIYLLPSGELTTNYGPSGSNGGVTSVSVIGISTPTPTPTSPTPTSPCKGNPVKNPQIAP